MKTLVWMMALALGVAATACGSAETCDTANCATNASRTYQSCAKSGNTTTVTYKYNGTSCDAALGNTSDPCLTAVVAWCMQ